MYDVSEQAKMMEAAGYVTVREASRLVGRTIYTIYRRHKAGKYPGEVVDGHLYIQKAALIPDKKAQDLLARGREELEKRAGEDPSGVTPAQAVAEGVGSA